MITKFYSGLKSSTALGIWCVLTGFFGLISGGANAGQVSLAWGASPSSTVAGYKMYYGSASGVYAANVDAGKATSVTVPSLQDGAKYYFAVLAYDAAGNKSPYSNEVSTTLPAAATASFSASATTVNASAAITLTPTYTGTAASWKWDFGDGSTPLAGTSSAVPTASKAYSKAGSYTVSLTVGSLVQSKVISVLPVAGFSASSVSGAAPFAVNFTDASLGSPTAWTWSFGDGSTSTQQNPSHSFSAAGTYNVSLTVNGTGLASTNSAVKTITVTAPVASTPPPAAPPSGFTGSLVAAYSFDEGAGLLTGDVSGNGNTATLGNSPTWTTGKFGKALAFGAGRYVTVPNSSAIDVGGQKLTISFFAKITDSGKDQVLIGKPANASFTYPWFQYGVEFSTSSKSLALYLADTAGVAHRYNMAAPTGVWTHVAFSYDGSNVKGYVDGVLKLNTAANFSITNAATALRFGLDPNGNQPANGALDEIRIYNSAQTNSDVSADLARSVASASPLMAAYSFDAGVAPVAADASGRKNTGTLVNNPTWRSGRFGTGLGFGGNKYVTVPNSTSVNIGGSGLTLSFYANITDSGKDQALLGKAANSSFAAPWYQYGIEFSTTTKALALYLADTAGVAHRYNMVAPLGVWTHVTFTHDGSTVKGYIDGVLKLNAAATFKIPTASTALRIGLDPLGNQPTNGALDEIRIYNSALSAAAIQANLKQAVVTTNPPSYFAGQTDIGSVVFPLPMGIAHAFQITASKSGVLTAAPIYIDGGSSTSKIIVGLYSDSSGHPGTLLAKSAVDSSLVGRWNSIPMPGGAIVNGRKYWLAVLSPHVSTVPVVYLRDLPGAGSGVLETSGQSALAALPLNWVVGNQTNDGPLAIFASGY